MCGAVHERKGTTAYRYTCSTQIGLQSHAILESQIRVPISRIDLETCKLEITQTGWGLRVMLEFKEGADRKPWVLNTHLSTQNYDSSVCCHHQKPVLWMKYM